MTCNDTTAYFLALPPLEHDASLVSFNLEVLRGYTPRWGGMFALYGSHPAQNVPFGAPIVQSFDWVGGTAATTFEEPPVSTVTLQAGEVYWIGVDFGPDEGGGVRPVVLSRRND